MIRSAICALAVLGAGAAASGPPSSPVSHDFAAYPTPAYRGDRKAPDFTGAGRAYRDFRSRLRDGFAHNRLFAGHYVLIGWGCGANCRDWVLGDVTTGRIKAFPISGEDYGAPQLDYRATSRLVRAQWNSLGDVTGVADHCMRQDIAVLSGETFLKGENRVAVGPCPYAVP